MKNIKRVHLIYPIGNKISTPETIGRHLSLALKKHYEVINHNYDEIKTITPGNSDILIGHWHPNPFTVFRMSTKKKGWKRILALAPFCPDITGWQNAFANHIIKKCDQYLAITGNAWMNRLKDSPFHHWKPKIIHLDLAVDRNDFPFIKKNFSPINNRRLLYIGHAEWYKNISFLEKISEKLKSNQIDWIGGNKHLKNIKNLGSFDFTKSKAIKLIQEYDFLITVGSADANPTTILEAMSWGLIPICSVQSGYENFNGIINISIDDLEEAAETIKSLQKISEVELKKLQQQNFYILQNQFNWERFCSQVLNAIESNVSPNLNEISFKQSFSLLISEFKAPNFWCRPNNFYKFIKTNLKYLFNKI